MKIVKICKIQSSQTFLSNVKFSPLFLRSLQAISSCNSPPRCHRYENIKNIHLDHLVFGAEKEERNKP
jgi:hypothetical protein